MDKIEADETSVSNAENGGATEVEISKESAEKSSASHDVTKSREAVRVSDGVKGRSSRRKPYKTHKVVDSEDEEEGDGEGNLDEYLKEKMREGLAYASHVQASGGDSATSGQDVSEEEEEEDMEEDEDEEDEEGTEEAHPPHLPEGTVVVQPVAVEDSSPSARFHHPADFPYGRKTRTDVIPDYVMCTACEDRIPTNSIDNFYRHPVLKVLLCRRCVAVYQSKPIRTGDDGIDDACRWCAEGGDLICCDFCHNAFCKGCIERNLGQQELNSILNAGDNEKWHCYVCHPHLLAKHVESCNSIIASVEEREKVARRRQKSSISRSPRRSQLMPGKAAAPPMASITDTAALASAIASQVMSANVGRRGGGRPRGGRGASNLHGATSKGNVLYIHTPSGEVVGIPAKSMDQLANVPMTAGSLDTPVKPRQTQRAARSPRASAPRPQFSNLPSLPMTSVTLSTSPPNINEYNVWAVLEKLLAATQSMGMLLGSLKDDLRRTGSNVVAMEQLKKRREVAMKLWRAFVAYKKSFLDIELFTRAAIAGSQTPQPAVIQQAKGNNMTPRTVMTPKSTAPNVAQLSEKGDMAGKSSISVGSEDRGTEKDIVEGRSGAQKRKADNEIGREAKHAHTENESADAEGQQDSQSIQDAEMEEGLPGKEDERQTDSRSGGKVKTEGADNKADLFSSLRFEPLFEITPMAKKE